MINIGKYIEMAINWLTDHFASFFDALSIGIGGFIDGFQHVLFGIPLRLLYLRGLRLVKEWQYSLCRDCFLFTAWDSGKRRCRHLPWCFLLPVWLCCWEYRWEFGRQTVTVVIKSCGLFWILCRRCLPLFI